MTGKDHDSFGHYRRDQRPDFGRAYVLLDSPEAVVAFHRGFDGHVFKAKTGRRVSDKNQAEHVLGEEFQAVVEFAPVQKTPYKAKVKADARQGTVDEGGSSNCFISISR